MHRVKQSAASWLVLGVVAATAALPAAAEPFRAMPVDEASEVPELATLRDALLAAVRARDVEAVVALADPHIVLSFGGDGGRETLRAWLEGDDETPWLGPEYWRQLQTALELGGSFWHDEAGALRDFCAPYTFYADYPVEWDVFEVIVVIGDAVPMHAGPDAASAVVATLDHDVTRIVDNGSGFDPENPLAPYWVRVQTADGAHEGWLLSDDFRSPVDYRACFHMDEASGAWTWDAFVAGD
ncbi:MAG: hypothetical protein R3F55_04290 [Alphaproteobacteria bacterium]